MTPIAPQPTPTLDRRPIASRRLSIVQRSAAWLARRGVAPNAISVAGMFCGVAAGLLLWSTAHGAAAAWQMRVAFVGAAALVLLRLTCNMLDGMVAVEGQRQSPTGELFNEIPDRVSDVCIILGAGYGATGWSAMGWAAALLAVLTAHIRAVGKGCGLPSDYGGPMAKQQRMALIVATAVALACLPERAWQSRWSGAALGVPVRIGVMGGLLCIMALGAAWTCVVRLGRIGAALNARAGAGQGGPR